MQQKQAAMGCDADPDLVGDLQTAAPFKLLFRQENLNVSLQFPAILIGQPKIKWTVCFNDLQPIRLKRGGFQFLYSLCFPHRQIRNNRGNPLTCRANPDARAASKALIAEGQNACSGPETFIYVNKRLEGNALETIDAMLINGG